MVLAAVLYLFSNNIVCGLVAILIFNMSMPITLRAAADIFKGGRGFSFGLLTFALFLGYVPSYISGRVQISRTAMCILCILSAAMLLTYALDMGEQAAWIENAVARVLDEGWRTRDIADANTPADKILGTAAMGDKVVAAL